MKRKKKRRNNQINVSTQHSNPPSNKHSQKKKKDKEQPRNDQIKLSKQDSNASEPTQNALERTQNVSKPEGNRCLTRNKWELRTIDSLKTHTGKLIWKSQNRSCSEDNPGVVFQEIFNSGMGSNLHTWSDGVRWAYNQNKILIYGGKGRKWHWSPEKCTQSDFGSDSLTCYFDPHPNCNVYMKNVAKPVISNWATRLNGIRGMHNNQNEIMEYLFSTIRPSIIAQAEKVCATIFPNSTEMDNMIALHVRWGDKSKENELIPVDIYINEVLRVATTDKPTVFLMTEDACFLDLLQKSEKTKNWSLKYFEFAIGKTGPCNKDKGPNADVEHKISPMKMLNQNADLGLYSIISLLIALEAKTFIGFPGSNWSRLLDQLRLTRRERFCENCTRFIGLSAKNGKYFRTEQISNYEKIKTQLL